MSPILETAISLVFVFLVFSLINSWIVEFLSMKLQRRGKFLYQFMTHYLNDQFNKNWGLMLYAHPLMEVLHREIDIKQGLFSFLRNNQLSTKRRLPAYMPPKQLASAMIDLVMKHDVPAAFIRNKETGKTEYVKHSDPPVQMEGRRILYGKEKEYEYEWNRDTYLFNEFLDGLGRLNESEMKTTLQSIARKVDTGASDKVNQLNSLIGEWFDSSMERLNGWYKRSTRKWLFFSGLGIAIIFNVNALRVVTQLYTDPQTRETVSRAAETYIREHPVFVNDTVPENFDALKEKVDILKSKLAPLPIGWGEQLNSYPIENVSTFNLYVIRPFKLFTGAVSDNLLGWLLTAFALSYGAPFWFDILKKFVNVRSAGLIPSADKKESDK
jgi:hypothetical protein